MLLAAQCSQALETTALLGNQAASCSSDSWPLSEESASLSSGSQPSGMEDLLRGLHQQQHALPSIVIATPGRLVAHLQSTPGFSVAGLRFLVCPMGLAALPVPDTPGSFEVLMSLWRHRKTPSFKGHKGNFSLPSRQWHRPTTRFLMCPALCSPGYDAQQTTARKAVHILLGRVCMPWLRPYC